jgi:hypothetical protein
LRLNTDVAYPSIYVNRSVNHFFHSLISHRLTPFDSSTVAPDSSRPATMPSRSDPNELHSQDDKTGTLVYEECAEWLKDTGKSAEMTDSLNL